MRADVGVTAKNKEVNRSRTAATAEQQQEMEEWTQEMF